MAQKKLFRFAQIKTFNNVLEYPPNMKGNWRKYFRNPNPVILELACGRGEYTIGLSKLHSNCNYIGVDIKGNRMYIGARRAIDEKLDNVAFLRTQIEKINDYFAPGEVDEIWITFPDPQLRASKAKKRLTHPRFLRLYHQFLKPGGLIHLKTDSPQLYEFTNLVIDFYKLNRVYQHENIYSSGSATEEIKIKTHYEIMDIAKSNRIHYICFSLPEILADIDEAFKNILYDQPTQGKN